MCSQLTVLIAVGFRVFSDIDLIHDGTFYSAAVGVSQNLKLYSEIGSAYGPLTFLILAPLLKIFGEYLVISRVVWFLVKLATGILFFRLLPNRFSLMVKLILVDVVLLLDSPQIYNGKPGVLPAGIIWPNHLLVLIALMFLLLLNRCIYNREHFSRLTAFLLGFLTLLPIFVRAQGLILTFAMVVVISLIHPRKIPTLFGLITFCFVFFFFSIQTFDFFSFIEQNFFLPFIVNNAHTSILTSSLLRHVVLIAIAQLVILFLIHLEILGGILSKLMQSTIFVIIVSFWTLPALREFETTSFRNLTFFFYTISHLIFVSLFYQLLYLDVNSIFQYPKKIRREIFRNRDSLYSALLTLMAFAVVVSAIPKIAYLIFALPFIILSYLNSQTFALQKSFNSLCLKLATVGISSAIIFSFLVYIQLPKYPYDSEKLFLFSSSEVIRRDFVDSQINYLSEFSFRTLNWTEGCRELYAGISGTYLPNSISYGPDIPYPPSPQLAHGLNLLCRNETLKVVSNTEK